MYKPILKKFCCNRDQNTQENKSALSPFKQEYEVFFLKPLTSTNFFPLIASYTAINFPFLLYIYFFADQTWPNDTGDFSLLVTSYERNLLLSRTSNSRSRFTRQFRTKNSRLAASRNRHQKRARNQRRSRLVITQQSPSSIHPATW